MAEAKRRDGTAPGDTIGHTAGQSTGQGMTEQTAEALRSLEARRSELQSWLSTERNHLDEQVMTAPGDVADESVIDTSADYFLKLATQHERELGEIDAALDRLHKGAYGLCQNCENPIASERLKRMPYARFCIDCQATMERQNRRLRPVPNPTL